MKKILLIALAIMSIHHVAAQSLKGTVLDSMDKESVPFASVEIVEINLGVKADVNGKFEFYGKIPENFTLKTVAIGYETSVKSIEKSNWNEQIILNPKHVELHEITVSGPLSNLQRENAIRIETRKINDLNSISNLNLGESLSQIPGVYNTSTGNAIAKPVVRGLQGIRVVTLLNGLRIENQQWGGDHGMGLTDLGIGSVELIKGPASLLYGADALGGVIYFVDEPFANQGKSELGFQSLNLSNTLGTINKLSFKRSSDKSRFSVFASYGNHADYQLPSGRFAENSRFSDYNLKMSFGMNTSRWGLQVKYTLACSSIGIPGHTHDSIINFSEFQSLERGREITIPVQEFVNNMLSIENKFFTKKGEFNFLVGQTINRLTEYEEKVTIPGIDMFLSNSLYHFKWKNSLTEKLNLVTGFQGMYQRIYNTNLGTEELLPNASMLDNGLYAVLFYNLKKSSFQGGVRGDQRLVNSISTFNDIPPTKRTFASLNFSLGWVQHVEKQIFRINISSGFRSPHLSELMSNGIHHGTLRYEIGDLNLKNETANQLDLSYEFHGEHFQIIVNPFYNRIQNFIGINPSDSIIEGFSVFYYKQKDLVNLFGSDFSIHYHPHFAHWLHIESSYSYIQASEKNGNPIAQIPQNRVNTNIKLSFKEGGKFSFEDVILQHMYFAPQNRVAAYEVASNEYHLVNIACNMRLNLKNPIHFGIGVKNVLNKSYIDHLSRLKNIQMPHPGRNIYLSIKYNFNNLNN
jgi:iron complex outermembrane receptor protein